MHPKLVHALDDLTARAPRLADAIRGHCFIEDGELLSVFAVPETGVISYHPELVDEGEGQSILFGLGVTAFMVLNQVKERGAGRNLLYWGIAANITGQSYVAGWLEPPARAKSLEISISKSFPGLAWEGKSVEEVYNSLLAQRKSCNEPALVN